jgi:hypothetical protein
MAYVRRSTQGYEPRMRGSSTGLPISDCRLKAQRGGFGDEHIPHVTSRISFAQDTVEAESLMVAWFSKRAPDGAQGDELACRRVPPLCLAA